MSTTTPYSAGETSPTPDQIAPANSQLPSTWTAVHDEIPQTAGRLTVIGNVETPTPGYKLHLTKAHPQGINPEILLLRLHRTAPTGIEPQHVAHEQVKYEENTHVPYKQVQILPDGVTINVVNIL